MTQLIKLVRAFKHDESGVFAVTFALMAIVLIALSGSVVDYTTLMSQRNATQIALDSSVLALHGSARSLNDAEISEEALSLMTSQLGTSNAETSLEWVRIDEQSNSLEIAVRLTVPTAFVTLVGVHELSAVVVSRATRRSTRLEVAMVLDNSGSMGAQSRMILLKQATLNATDIFFEGMSEHKPDVFVSVVPFTQFVNVGRSNANAPWIDRYGRSTIADDNFIQDPDSPIPGGYDRLALFDRLRNEAWRGCVEARKAPFDTDDTPPTPADPDTLFVPLFAPDEPDSTNRFGQYHFNNTYLPDSPRSCEQPRRNQSFSDRTLQERLCKYDGAMVSRVSMEHARGPNADCPHNALTPLTNNKQDVRSAINAMSPQGGTNIAQGAVWGLHTLTPGAPFGEAEAFEDDVNKSMIILTDGDNFASASNNMNGATFYTAYGYPYNRRLGQPGDSTGRLQGLMNERLTQTCANAKAMGVKIYTIGLSITDRDTQAMLARCSSGEGYAHLPKRASQLTDIFEQIAGQLSALRLSK